MTFEKLQPFIVYKVTKASTDCTFAIGDIIYISENGRHQKSIVNGGYGFLTEDELSNPMTIDFECEPSPDYCVFRSRRNTEILCPVSVLETTITNQRAAVWNAVQERLSNTERSAT